MELPRHLLPPKLLEIAEYCGEEVALALLEHFGGATVYVPEVLSDAHPLAQKLGVEMAQRLCDEFGHQKLDVPKADRAKQELRNIIIRKRISNGENRNALACEFKLTSRTISEICNSGKPVYQQVDWIGS